MFVRLAHSIEIASINEDASKTSMSTCQSIVFLKLDNVSQDEYESRNFIIDYSIENEIDG
jgi:hypothetical protein